MINHCAAQVWPQKRFLFRADYFQSSMAFKGRSATALVQPELFCFKKQLKFSIKTAKKKKKQTCRLSLAECSTSLCFECNPVFCSGTCSSCGFTSKVKRASSGLCTLRLSESNSTDINLEPGILQRLLDIHFR